MLIFNLCQPLPGRLMVVALSATRRRGGDKEVLKGELTKNNIAGSSNGRTSGFGPEYWGSSPYPAAV